MTSSLIIKRQARCISIVAGPLEAGEAVARWKGMVNADIKADPEPGVIDPPALEVVECVVVRSHKLRGAQAESEPPVGQAESEPPVMQAESEPPVEQAESSPAPLRRQR